MVCFNDMQKEKIGVKIVQELIRLGYTKYRLAKDMGVARPTVYAWQVGLYFDEAKHLKHLQDLRYQYIIKKNLDPFKRY